MGFVVEVLEDRGRGGGRLREHEHALTQKDRFLDIMRYEHRGQAVFLDQFQDDVLQALAGKGVKRVKRFIHKQQIRLEDKGAAGWLRAWRWPPEICAG